MLGSNSFLNSDCFPVLLQLQLRCRCCASCCCRSGPPLHAALGVLRLSPELQVVTLEALLQQNKEGDKRTSEPGSKGAQVSAFGCMIGRCQVVPRRLAALMRRVW